VRLRSAEAAAGTTGRPLSPWHWMAVSLPVGNQIESWLEANAVLVDYLRFVAFAGRLRGFFADGLYNYVDPAITTGQHLRYAPAYLRRMLDWPGHLVVHGLYWEPYSKDAILERLIRDIGIAGGGDS